MKDEKKKPEVKKAPANNRELHEKELSKVSGGCVSGQHIKTGTGADKL